MVYLAQIFDTSSHEEYFEASLAEVDLRLCVIGVWRV